MMRIALSALAICLLATAVSAQSGSLQDRLRQDRNEAQRRRARPVEPSTPPSARPEARRGRASATESLAAQPQAAARGGRPARAPERDTEVRAGRGPLAGLTGEAVRARLGAPLLARAEGAGAMWTYRLETCVLFVFFTGESEDRLVSGVSTGSLDGVSAPVPAEACLAGGR